MKLTPQVSLTFNGQCEAAFTFYERCLNGTISGFFRYRGSPMASQAPPGWEDKIMHATLTIGESAISGADVPQYETPRGFSILLQMNDPVAAERVFQALSENARIETPFQKTFWASGFGSLIDQFGIPWSVNCE